MTEPVPISDARPGLAMIANCVTPYRIHLHELIAAGIPELKLHTLISHDDGDFKWTLHPPKNIHVSHFGSPGDTPTSGVLRAPLREWWKGGRIINYLRANNVRVVICGGHRYLSYLRVINDCYRRGIPIFVNNDSNIRSERRLNLAERWLKRKLYSWWLKRTNGVMPFGRLGEQFYLKYGADGRRFYQVPCWPDYDGFAHVDLDRLQRFRRQHGLDEGRRIILFSGRLTQVKRVDLLIGAFARMAAERPEWDLLIVGDGALAAELHQSAENLGSRVKWTGFLQLEELPLAYHASDVLALPSDHEPWALVVQEAMAAGLAVVSSDVVGAAYELVTDGGNGRIFPAGDVEALRMALLETTAPENIDRFKQQSRAALAKWRAEVNPVDEVRRALVDVGVLSD